MQLGGDALPSEQLCGKETTVAIDDFPSTIRERTPDADWLMETLCRHRVREGAEALRVDSPAQSVTGFPDERQRDLLVDAWCLQGGAPG